MGTQQATRTQIDPANEADHADRAFHAAVRALNWDEATMARFEAGRTLMAEFSALNAQVRAISAMPRLSLVSA